jgi:hypothetical protein
MNAWRISACVSPEGSLEVLSQSEASKLFDHTQKPAYELFRRCSLAVLNCGSSVDNAKLVFEEFSDFDIRVIQRDGGVQLEVINAPSDAFVDGEMIKGIKEHLFAVLRDIVFVSSEINNNPKFNLHTSAGITNAIFHILRNARILKPQAHPNIVVCWGGHAISREEYEYTKEVGYELGLRDMNVCTGCGPGAMKGPMKGATIGHAKQRNASGRYIGISEPGIIAAEAPNPIVNDLVIMPDIEKRLESFIRLGHAVAVFPGGVGTAEEILYLLGVLLHPQNKEIPYPLIFTGPGASEAYFSQIHQFIGATLGPHAQQRYRIIIDEPSTVAREINKGVAQVRRYRETKCDADYYNWQLKVEEPFQIPFNPTHQNMNKLELFLNLDKHQLAANLRKAFSGIVAGNVKADGIRAIEQHGPFKIHGDPALLRHLDDLLAAFVDQGRMKLMGDQYSPCYRLVA